MCVDPITAITIATTVASAGVSMVGANNEAKAAQQAAEYQSRIAAQNQQIALNNATDARNRGDKAAMDKQLETRALLGKQRSIFADRNISAASGTAIEVLGDTASFGALDALTIRQNFEREAISHETQANNFFADSQMASMSAKNAGVAGRLGVISAGIGGLDSLARFGANRKMAVR